MTEWKEFTPELKGDGAGYSCEKAEYRQVGNRVETRFKLQGSKPTHMIITGYELKIGLFCAGVVGFVLGVLATVVMLSF
jgi:hypothetical protein